MCWLRNNTKTLFSKTLLGMLSISLTVLVIVVTVLFIWFRLQMVNGYYELTGTTMRNADAVFNSNLSDAKNLVMEWYSSADGINLRLNKDADFFKHMSFVNRISGILNNNSYYQSVYFLNSEKMISLNLNSNSSTCESIDDILIQKLSELNIRNQAFTWKAKSRKEEDGLIPILSVPMAEQPMSEQEFYGMTVMNINLLELNKSLFSGQKEEKFRIMIFDDTGIIVADSNMEHLGDDWSDRDWVKQILEDNTQFTTKIEGKRWEFLSFPSCQDGYYIVAQTDYMTQILNINYIFYIVFTVIVIAVTVIIVMMLLVSKKIFMPFTSMVKQLKETEIAEEMKAETDEIEFLEHFYQGISNHLDTLKQKKEKDFIVKNLLIGNQSKEVQKLLQQEGIIAGTTPYYMILVFVKNKEAADYLNMQEYDMVRNMVSSVFLSVLEQYGSCTYFEVGLRKMLFLLSGDRGLELPEQTIIDIVDKAGNSVKKLSRVRITAVLSPCLKDGGLECVTYFRKMDGCLKTRYLLECQETIVVPNEQILSEISTEAVVEYLKQRDKANYMSEVEQVLKEYEKLLYDAFTVQLEQLVMAVLKAGKLSKNKEQVRERIASITGREELLLWLEALYDEAVLQINKANRQTATVMMESAVDYIRNNYDDCNLNVNLLADKLHISAAYFGKLFTEFTGTRTLDYILKVRMDKAGELLLAEEDKDIAQIAEMVGYSNSTYFTTAFKKYYGITPSGYRDYHVLSAMKEREE